MKTVICDYAEIIRFDLVDENGIPTVGSTFFKINPTRSISFSETTNFTEGNASIDQVLTFSSLSVDWGDLKSGDYVQVKFSVSDGTEYLFGTKDPENPAQLVINSNEGVYTVSVIRNSTEKLL